MDLAHLSPILRDLSELSVFLSARVVLILFTYVGGFCGTIMRQVDFDAKDEDGIYLRVRGDGNRYKFRLKPSDLASRNEYQYQASFDTQAG